MFLNGLVPLVLVLVTTNVVMSLWKRSWTKDWETWIVNTVHRELNKLSMQVNCGKHQFAHASLSATIALCTLLQALLHHTSLGTFCPYIKEKHDSCALGQPGTKVYGTQHCGNLRFVWRSDGRLEQTSRQQDPACTQLLFSTRLVAVASRG